jgi:hypothetical protein
MQEHPTDLKGARLGLCVFGGILGFIVPNVLIGIGGLFGELISRFMNSLNGTGGESAQWGEPAFYLAIFGVPGAAVGLIIAFFLGRAFFRSDFAEDVVPPQPNQGGEHPS